MVISQIARNQYALVRFLDLSFSLFMEEDSQLSKKEVTWTYSYLSTLILG